MARPQSLRQSLPGILHTLRYFWPLIRKERKLIVVAVGALFLSLLMKLAEPWPVALVIDNFVTGEGKKLDLPFLRDLDQITLLTVLAVALVLFTAVRAYTTFYHKLGFARIGNRVLVQVRERLYVHLQKLSLSFHTKARGGDLTVRVTTDASMLRDVAATALIPLFANVLLLFGMTALMLVLQWKLTLLALAIMPLFAVTTLRTSKKIQTVAREKRKRDGAMASTAAESLAAIKSVQALSLEDAFSGEFTAISTKSQKEDLKGQRLSAKLERTVDVLIALATALVLWFGAQFVMDGEMSPGELLVFLAYLKRSFRPARDFARYSARLAKASASAERVIAILELEPDVRDLPHAKPAPRLTGAIHFEGVRFSYEENTSVLEQIDLKIESGTFFALVGPSGIGKSTLASLIMRLYDPTEGRVTVDGHDLRDLTIASLREQISVVLQETILFAATIRENISYGVADANPEKIERAARLAGIHDFICDLPDGYDTMIGERGATLSAGQRQRMAVARAAMRDTPILVLDEPTTGLDEENERLVVDSIRSLAADRTTLLITHDLKLAAKADVVGYLDRGRIVEYGSPDDLLARGGRFKELYDMQMSDAKQTDSSSTNVDQERELPGHSPKP